jgi:release factor glutamine methyltransferase
MTAPPGDVWTIRRVLTWASEDLRARGSASPRLDTELMLGKVLGLDRVKLIIDGERPLSKDELASYRALHQRRRAGEPIAYLRGVREFYGHTFVVDKRVLVPRPETEVLVEVGLERTRHLALSARTLDLCTGSGCVAIAIARERPTVRVLGLDMSADAVAVARENALRLGAVNAGFVQSDLFAAFEASAPTFELVTANPPYVPEGDLPTLPVDVRAFEPHLALFGGSDGLSIVRRIVEQAPRFLAKEGVLAMEIGFGQAAAVRALLDAAAYRSIETRRDLAGIERIVSAVTPA